MKQTKVQRSDLESESLQSQSQEAGKAQEGLLDEVIQTYPSKANNTYRLSLLQQAKGMWKDRDDLPDLRELR